MKATVIAIAITITTTPALAGGEPTRPTYYAPPVIVTPPPNPLVGLGALAGGLASLPFAVLGGLFGAIAVPPVVSCVSPDGSLFPCPVVPAYPLPAYDPGYEPQEPLPGYYPNANPARPPSAPSGPVSGHCYGPDGSWRGGGNPDCRG